LNILTPLATVSGVYYTNDNVTSIGTDYEDDATFRVRWLSSSVKDGTNTSDGMFKALLDIVANGNCIKIRMNRGAATYGDLALHTMNIVIHSSSSNTTIANIIFSALTDGVALAGTTSITVQDSSNENVTIAFTRASEISMYVSVDAVVKTGYNISDLAPSIKSAIVTYGNTTKGYGMGNSVVANQFVSAINVIEGIDYINTIKVSRNGTTWVDLITMGDLEVPIFSTVNIAVT